MSVRAKICLNKIYKDYRKEAFVYVDPNFKNVSDFEKHIQKLFNIPYGIYLTITGSLLPSEENVRVIQSGDVIMYISNLYHNTISILSSLNGNICATFQSK